MAFNPNSALGDAIVFLDDILTEEPYNVKYVQKCARDSGINLRTLRKAKDILGVQSFKGAGYRSVWFWRLPGDQRVVVLGGNPAGDAQGAPPREGHLGDDPPQPQPSADRSPPAAAPDATGAGARSAPSTSPSLHDSPATPESPETNRFRFLETD